MSEARNLQLYTPPKLIFVIGSVLKCVVIAACYCEQRLLTYTG
jgi:hypothetical protein